MQVDANVCESDIGARARGAAVALHGRRVPRPFLRGPGRAGAQRADHGAERRDLRRRDRGGEPGPRAEARHDGDGLDHHRAPRRRAARAAARAALQAGSAAKRVRSAAPAHVEPGAPSVYVLDANGAPQRVEIQTGLRDDRHAELLAGDIAPGDGGGGGAPSRNGAGRADAGGVPVHAATRALSDAGAARRSARPLEGLRTRRHARRGAARRHARDRRRAKRSR